MGVLPIRDRMPMDSKLAAELDLSYFHDNGYSRHQCVSCGNHFWSLVAQERCGDAPCVEYDFIGNPLAKRPFDMTQMREAFSGFFERNGHTRVPRRPVVARWREDIYLTIASIADFQPFVTSGEVPPPANPLVVSQPCIRLNDLASVGRTGRHFTQFEMMGHHAFNRPDERVYWANETVAYGDEFLTKDLGIPRERITYKEGEWAGGGNAGPCVEVLAGGLEVATLVFMGLEEKKNGQIEVKGDRYDPMELQVVDTGWGLERLVWSSRGTPTAYECVFPEVIEELADATGLSDSLKDERVARIAGEHSRVAGVMSLDLNSSLLELRQVVAKRLGEHDLQTSPDELQRIMQPIEDTYAIADHSRCLSFMLGDGIVPSNAKAGYLARLVIRRTLRLAESVGLTMPLREVVALQLEVLRKDFPELSEALPRIEEILDLETDRYRETIEKGTRLIERTYKGKKAIGEKELVDLYDTHGLAPDIVRRVAEPLGVAVDVPDAFDAMVAELHSKAAAKQEAEPLVVDVPATKMLYYDHPEMKEFDATVVWVEGNLAAFDQTAFYPEGGGQEEDHGMVVAGATELRVEDCQKLGNGVIVHTLSAPVTVGTKVHGVVDWDRRWKHMRHHTATHIMCAAAREVLGSHAWQMGAYKSEEHGRIDVSHFKRIDPETAKAIERRANEIVAAGIPIDRRWWPREEAERQFGVVIYQGGVVPGRNIRIIRIGERDVEACGGTHCANTSEVGIVKLTNVERLQDGIERMVYAAGPVAVERIQAREDLLRSVAETFSVPIEQAPAAAQRFFAEWKEYRKQVEKLSHLAIKEQRAKLLQEAEAVGGAKLVVAEVDLEMKDLIALAGELTQEKGVAVALASRKEGAKLVVGRSADLGQVNASDVLKAACGPIGGGGGGKPNLAQGGGPKAEGIPAALDEARKRLQAALG